MIRMLSFASHDCVQLIEIGLAGQRTRGVIEVEGTERWVCACCQLDTGTTAGSFANGHHKKSVHLEVLAPTP
jgi:hypothetical protein